jgi:hypothetical protein
LDEAGEAVFVGLVFLGCFDYGFGVGEPTIEYGDGAADCPAEDGRSFGF